MWTIHGKYPIHAGLSGENAFIHCIFHCVWLPEGTPRRNLVWLKWLWILWSTLIQEIVNPLELPRCISSSALAHPFLIAWRWLTKCQNFGHDSWLCSKGKYHKMMIHHWIWEFSPKFSPKARWVLSSWCILEVAIGSILQWSSMTWMIWGCQPWRKTHSPHIYIYLPWLWSI